MEVVIVLNVVDVCDRWRLGTCSVRQPFLALDLIIIVVDGSQPNSMTATLAPLDLLLLDFRERIGLGLVMGQSVLVLHF